MMETLNHFFSKALYVYWQTWIEAFLESNPVLQESFKLVVQHDPIHYK